MDSLAIFPSRMSAPSRTTMALAFCASLKKAVTPRLCRGLTVIEWESSSVQLASCGGSKQEYTRVCKNNNYARVYKNMQECARICKSVYELQLVLL